MFLALVASVVCARVARADVVVRARIDDQAITPITARFVEGALGEADRVGAKYLVIELDTPGGVVDATRRIVRDMLASRTRIVVYVSPAGARAASAGLFLALASNVTAMAPGTNIGAAHPVQIGGLPGAPEERQGDKVLGEKIVNDTRAWARSLAEYRGRNVELAEAAVVESRSFTATEAAKAGLVDFVAADFGELLGHLGARGATVKSVELSWGQRFLAVLASPNLAFILLLLGFYGLAFEFHAGSFGVAGVLGGVCLVLAFVGLSVLPLSYAGLALLVLGIALLIAEAFVVSFGLLTVGGVACLILGGLMLVDSPTGFVRVSLVVVIAAALATAAIATFVLAKAIKAHRSPVKTGAEALSGASAVAVEAFRASDGRYRGTVRVHGEYWSAVSKSPVASGDAVAVVHRDGLILTVDPSRQADERESQ